MYRENNPVALEEAYGIEPVVIPVVQLSYAEKAGREHFEKRLKSHKNDNGHTYDVMIYDWDRRQIIVAHFEGFAPLDEFEQACHKVLESIRLKP
jgi:hypothetical protein